jgi:small GTP-binding protein
MPAPTIKSFHTFVFGIDYAGKTALYQTLREHKEMSATKPTLSFNVGKLLIENIEFVIWDAPGQKPFREVWKQGYARSKILVFVLDTADPNRYGEAFEEFKKVINDPITKAAPLVFCFHKMDLDNSKSNLANAKAFFNLVQVKPRKLFIYETSIYEPTTMQKLRSILVDISLGVLF